MSELMYSTISDHTTQAKARQVEFFKDKPNFDALIGLFVDRLQLLEDVIEDFRDKRHIDGAEGIQIDNLGLIFQESRGSLADTPYRAAVLNAYTKKAKSGEPETLIQAFGAYTNANKVTFTRYRPCTVILNAEVDDPSALTTDHIYAGMQKIRAAGICLDTTISRSVRPFTFISLGDLVDDELGFSDTGDSSKGGYLGAKI